MDPITQTLAQPGTTLPSPTPVTDAEDAVSTGTTANALTSDFETFLKLLTAQMQNQDPQDPLDSTQFVSQLASFSAVEQQISTNEKLDDLITAMSASTAGQMASWIGAEVQSDAAANFTGAPIDISYTLPEGSAQAQILVLSQDGARIAALPVERGSTSITWDGTGSDGLTAPNGTYKFELESFDQRSSLGKTPAQTFSAVSEVRLVDGDMVLMFADGSSMPASQVVAIR